MNEPNPIAAKLHEVLAPEYEAMNADLEEAACGYEEARERVLTRVQHIQEAIESLKLADELHRRARRDGVVEEL